MLVSGVVCGCLGVFACAVWMCACLVERKDS